MTRKRILGEIKLKFVSKGDSSNFSIVIDGNYRDDRYKDTIDTIQECITKALEKISNESKGKKK